MRRPVEPKQFTSWAFSDRVKNAGLALSMGRVRRRLRQRDDGGILGRVQTELLNRKRWRTRLELANAIFETLEVFQDRKRATAA